MADEKVFSGQLADLVFDQDGLVTNDGGNYTLPALFGYEKSDGTYGIVSGEMHFKDGFLVNLTADGRDWRTPGYGPLGPVVVMMYSEMKPVDAEWLTGRLVKMYFADGKLLPHVRRTGPVRMRMTDVPSVRREEVSAG